MLDPSYTRIQISNRKKMLKEFADHIKGKDHKLYVLYSFNNSFSIRRSDTFSTAFTRLHRFTDEFMASSFKLWRACPINAKNNHLVSTLSPFLYITMSFLHSYPFWHCIVLNFYFPPMRDNKTEYCSSPTPFLRWLGALNSSLIQIQFNIRVFL